MASLSCGEAKSKKENVIKTSKGGRHKKDLTKGKRVGKSKLDDNHCRILPHRRMKTRLPRVGFSFSLVLFGTLWCKDFQAGLIGKHEVMPDSLFRKKNPQSAFRLFGILDRRNYTFLHKLSQ